MADFIDEALSERTSIRLFNDPRHTTRSFYQYIFNIDPDVFKVKHEVFCYALEKEGIPCWEGYQAMHHYDLFQPSLSRLPVPSAFPERFNFNAMSFPNAERAGEAEAVWLEESIFRAGRKGVEDVIRAIQKILVNTGELVEVAKMLQ
jgi:dTDP-4-amino-4,6-dideoxygalactose transaminase